MSELKTGKYRPTHAKGRNASRGLKFKPGDTDIALITRCYARKAPLFAKHLSIPARQKCSLETSPLQPEGRSYR